MDKKYQVGKNFKGGEVTDQIGTFDELKEAKKACIKGYCVYDETGRLVYSNRKKYKYLLVFLLVLGAITVGATFGYIALRDKGPGQVIKFPNGAELIYEGGKPVPDKCGIYSVPSSGYKMLLTNGSTKHIKEGALIKSDGTIVEPNGNTKLVIDKHCNIIVNGKDGATVTLPNGDVIQVEDNSVVNPAGVVVDPDGKDNLRIDDFGNIIVGDDGATVTLPDGTEIDVPKGTVITPDGKVIIPDDGSNIKIDENGKIIIEDGGATIYTPNCGQMHVPKGTIIVPEGTIIKPNGNANLTIDKNGYVIVGEGGATIIRNDCTEIIVPPGTVITDDGYVINPDDKDGNGDGVEVDDKGNIIVTDPDGGTIHTPKCGDLDVPKGTVMVPGGTIVIPNDGSELVIDKFGYIHVPEGGAKVVLPNCAEKEVPEGTIITPEGDVIIPKGDENPTVDDDGNIIIPDDGGTIITPKCGEREVPGGTIMVPGGTIVIPKEGSKLVVDEHGYVHLPEGGTVILPNCTEKEVDPDTIVTPPGTVIEPGEEPDIDDDGRIIIDEDDDDTKVTQPGGCEINVPAGSIIYKGLIIIGSSTENPYINKKGQIVIPQGGKVIYPDCTEEKFPNGGIVDDDGGTSHGIPEDPTCDSTKQCCPGNKYPSNPRCPAPPVCNSNTSCCAGDSYPTNQNCAKPVENLSIAYMQGQELNLSGIRPSDDVIGSSTFYVKNTGSAKVTFNVLWTQVYNNFSRPQDLVVTVKIDGNTVLNEVPCPTTNGYILENIVVEKGVTMGFELVFKYKETGFSQDEDQGKTFTTVVQIEASANQQ